MVEREDHPRRIMQSAAAHLLEAVDRHRRRGIGSKHEIDGADDHVSSARISPRPGGEDFFADGLRAGHTSTFSRPIQAAPMRLPMVFTVVRTMSSGRSMPVTKAIPAA